MKEEYDITSKVYDPLLYPALRGIRKTVTEILTNYKLQNKKILDLCCGTGNQLKILSKNGFTDLHCLDLSKEMLNVAKKGNYNINFYLRDATQTEFEDSEFDVVILSFAIHEKKREDQEKMLKEAHRVLKKDGLFLVVDYKFDEKTTFYGKLGVEFTEKIAGKEHFRNFKNYTKLNGLNSLLDTNLFELIDEKRKIFGTVTVAVYRKK